MRPAPFVVSLVFGACALPPGAGPADLTIEPLAGPGPLCFDRSRPDWLVVTRVIDAITGEAIAGARVHQVYERDQPRGGVFFRDATWHADELGFVRIPARDTARGWFIVESDRHGPIANMSFVPDVVRLVPGVDVRVRATDPLDRPIAHAGLGMCLGCGHTPDVRIATTDARGEAVLRCIEPTGSGPDDSNIRDLYLRAAGVSCAYDEIGWRLGDGPVALRPPFVPAVRGRITGPSGTPIAGVALGGGLHRGPWAWSASDGSFCHVGRESGGESLRMLAFGRELELLPPFTDRELDVVLPVAEPAARTHARLRVLVCDATDTPLQGALVQAAAPGLVHPGDANGSEVTDAHGRCELEVPAGPVDVLVQDGERAVRFEPSARTVTATVNAIAEVVVRPALREVRRVLVADEFRSVQLVTAGDTDFLDALLRDDQPVPLPAHEPFALVLQPREGPERRFVFSSLPPGPITLRPFAPTRVRFRAVDANGRPVAARAAIAGHPGELAESASWQQTDAGGVAIAPTHASGCAFLRIAPAAGGLRERTVHLSLPPPGDDVVQDLGEVVLRATDRAQLRIVQPDGKAASGTVSVLRPGLPVSDLPLGEDGGFDALDLVAGDRLELAPPQGRAVAMVWQGQPTWRLPERAEIRFEVVDADGLQPTGLAALFDGRVQNEWKETLVLEDLPAGDVEIFVGAAGCVGARVRLRLQPGERRTVPVVLRRA